MAQGPFRPPNAEVAGVEDPIGGARVVGICEGDLRGGVIQNQVRPGATKAGRGRAPFPGDASQPQ
eukprot:1759145-Lingulodinium_polyedra.AAC.1